MSADALTSAESEASAGELAISACRVSPCRGSPSLGLDKDDLVQVLGLSFTVSTVALAAGLASRGSFHGAGVTASTLCTAPALAGMWLGAAIRARVEPGTFRRVFLGGLLLLGADLMARSII